MVTTLQTKPRAGDFMSNEYTVKVIKGIHSSEDDNYDPKIGGRFDLITIEIDGRIYNQEIKLDTPVEPWLIQSLIDRMGASEDLLSSGILMEYLLDRLQENDVNVITVDEMESMIAEFTTGWDAHKEWEEKQRQSKK